MMAAEVEMSILTRSSIKENTTKKHNQVLARLLRVTASSTFLQNLMQDVKKFFLPEHVYKHLIDISQ